MEQEKIHFLPKVPLLSRKENVFLSQHPTHDHGIFLHRKVRHDLNNITEFIGIFLAIKMRVASQQKEKIFIFMWKMNIMTFKKIIPSHDLGRDEV